MNRQFVMGIIIAISFYHVAVSSPIAAPEGAPEDVVSAFQEQLVNVMKIADKLTVRERFAQLSPAVDAAFDMPLMTQIAVGSHWSTTSDNDRNNVIKAFRDMSISTLATLFDGYSGEIFEHQMNEPGPSKTIIVRTDLIKTNKSRIQIAYVMRQFNEGWRIIDVVVDGGISELKVRRSEYRMILKTKGIAGLIGLLNNKSKQLMSDSVAG